MLLKQTFIKTSGCIIANQNCLYECYIVFLEECYIVGDKYSLLQYQSLKYLYNIFTTPFVVSGDTFLGDV